MRKTREILRLCLGEGRSVREAARSVSTSSTTVWNCLERARRAGLSWPLPAEMDEACLEQVLYATESPQRRWSLPDFLEAHRELRRKGVTLQLLWQEYREGHPEDGYSYSQYCEHYRRFEKRLHVVMRQDHRAGEKMFVDYSGDGIPIRDPATGEVQDAELFVAVLGASSYTFAEATSTQTLKDWIQSHVHAFEFFGGVAEITVPDQTRTAVVKPSRYEPGLHPTYLELARHYDTVIVPARPRKPRDKAKVEAAVLLAQRWIVAALRHQVFFTIRQANEAIRELLGRLNGRKLQKLDVSRRELYEALCRAALRPLPPTRYEYAEWSRARVSIDYHVEVKRHYYSVPYQLVGEQVEVRLTASTVELFRKGRRVASHPRSDQAGRHTTLREHMPKSHQAHLEWTPSRIITWARKTGESTAHLVERILKQRPHPELGYRACLGVLRMGKTYGAERLEAACARALAAGTHSYRSVQSILKSGLDRQPWRERGRSHGQGPSTPKHPNVRGPDEYQ